jgi:hypothetical protein
MQCPSCRTENPRTARRSARRSARIGHDTEVEPRCAPLATSRVTDVRP